MDEYYDSINSVPKKAVFFITVLTILLLAVITALLYITDNLSTVAIAAILISGIVAAVLIFYVSSRLKYVVSLDCQFFSVSMNGKQRRLQVERIEGFEKETIDSVNSGFFGMVHSGSNDNMLLRFPGTAYAVRVYTKDSSLAVGTNRPDEFIEVLSAVTGLKAGKP